MDPAEDFPDGTDPRPRDGASGGGKPTIRVVMLFPFFPPDYSGAGIQGERLARELAAAGVEVQVLAPLHPGVDAPRVEQREGLRIRRFRVPQFDFERKFSLGFQAAVWLAGHSDWDLLHIHGFGYYAIAPATVARSRGRRVLVKTTLSGGDGVPKPDGRPHHRLIVEAYRRVDAVVALSAELEAGFREDPDFRAHVVRIPNGVDTERFRPASAGEKRAARGKLGIVPDEFVVVTAGRLDHRKRVVDLVKAVGRAASRPLCALLAGPDSPFPEDPPMLDRAEAGLSAEARVQRLGNVSPDDLPDVYRAADAFVLASSAEGMPNALLEAMATGLPCIATDIPGARDLLEGGEGHLYSVGDIAALARGIDALVADPAAATALGARAREAVVSHYSLGAVVGRYEAEYRRLLEGDVVAADSSAPTDC